MDVVESNYIVAAVGANVIPITTPPVFDQLLQPELKSINGLYTVKGNPSKLKREAKNLFTMFRGVPVLDSCLQAVARLGKGGRSEPGSAITVVAQGFISPDAAKSIGDAMLHVLDRVSPANSRTAWVVVGAVPVFGAFFATANSFNALSPTAHWSALIPLASAMMGSVLAVLLVSPAAWLLSAFVSHLMRLRVPPEYRQRGRNWAPLKKACGLSLTSSFVGALYGFAGAMHWVPSVRDSAEPIVTYAIAHTAPGTEVSQYLTRLVTFQTNVSPTSAMTESETVRDVQRYLIVHNYLHGLPDGNMGPRTVSAIAKYERREHLNSWIPASELLAYMRRH
ncbi:hypothetical protein GGD40_003693 [Paraburkholderia bryophila]|uniref:Peptidoglycan binding-like domain-containing protein n=1 Tax=Paraburkholderia bryophila TaxID=420952 RepID=A0A7Z0B7K4_9BURK|nr:peptidoglycan-binding domain-containing protein [Paraburkholderia bryophila]NYH24214.1 hypothetical protein [Paraburkholderia bryophila]